MNEVIILPKVSFYDAIVKGINNYINFKKRIRRSEFWFFFLFLSMFEIAIIILRYLTKKERINFGNIYYYELFIFFPSLSSIIRRLHDCGKSGFFIFVFFIPMVGPFLLLFYLCSDSQKEENEYGPSTKYISCEKINDPLYQKDQYNPINQDENELPKEKEENDDDHSKLNE